MFEAEGNHGIGQFGWVIRSLVDKATASIGKSSLSGVISSAEKLSGLSEPMHIRPGQRRPLSAEIWGEGTSASSRT
jgi:hypothetical protein